jgi:hypothetical protein
MASTVSLLASMMNARRTHARIIASARSEQLVDD